MDKDQAEKALQIILRVFGSTSLTALVFVMVPYSLMNDIHTMLGLGTLSDQPFVGYLARSTSALYALLGGLLWLISFDLQRYRAVIRYLGLGMALLGIALLFIDYAEGLPLLWRVWEGPFVFVVGIVIFLLAGKIPDKR